MTKISEPLLKSAIHVGEMPSGSLLILDNSHYPWFLIVPAGEFVEWIDIPLETQQKMLTDINSLSKFLLEDSGLNVGKINVGAIGNIVPQFHLHIVGRHTDDPAWPGPVWGHSAHRNYAAGEMSVLVDRLKDYVDDFDDARGC
ncbi:MAG: HIT family protein [Verrucomicrobiales bacterium]|nr:HIT family protein [Verrucomicrobiales bacterium]